MLTCELGLPLHRHQGQPFKLVHLRNPLPLTNNWWPKHIRLAGMNSPVFHFSFSSHYYRPQRSWARVIFSQACVKNSVHRGGEGVCLSACWDTPPGPGRPPREQTHHPSPQTRQTPPPGADTPPLPPGQADPPRTRQTPHPTPRGSRLQHTVYERLVRDCDCDCSCY